jgi:hypothetical protein
LERTFVANQLSIGDLGVLADYAQRVFTRVDPIFHEYPLGIKIYIQRILLIVAFYPPDLVKVYSADKMK